MSGIFPGAQGRAVPILAIAAWIMAIAGAFAESRVALVIGNNDYEDSGRLEDLGACLRDADLVKRTLEEVGFQVVAGTDLSKSAMDEKLTEFEQIIEKGGVAVFYFAGHAIEIDGKNYLLGTNAKLEARSRLGEEAMEAETFAAAMLVAGAKSSFLMLDCCRDAPGDLEWLTRGSGRKSGLAEIDIDGDIIIGFAAKPGAAALEPDLPGANSPYATALAKWIPSGLKHGDVFEQVRREVHEATGGLQRTWESGAFLEPFFFTSNGATREATVSAVRTPDLTMGQETKRSTTDTGDTLIEIRAKLDSVTRKIEKERIRFAEADQIIRKLTFNMKRPVVEGSMDHFNCLRAAKIMEEVQQGAPALIEEKESLELQIKLLEARPE